ncbi:hypothetical protein GGD63_007216 [Bradyrhizobium sp. cir1]|nr:hypothetical protein [Bradyrhizobium sp. cir1]
MIQKISIFPLLVEESELRSIAPRRQAEAELAGTLEAVHVTNVDGECCRGDQIDSSQRLEGTYESGVKHPANSVTPWDGCPMQAPQFLTAEIADEHSSDSAVSIRGSEMTLVRSQPE